MNKLQFEQFRKILNVVNEAMLRTDDLSVLMEIHSELITLSGMLQFNIGNDAECAEPARPIPARPQETGEGDSK